ncbi:hypothetical protein Rhopal_001620-T1 [Rhodotorula paludigena]|uniref:Uncharacterized protein n=1 Tax=Rhodotorula paludigena TaxID=86838 RepID=A0AAV5GHB2_9BASI|nr:hypothetical protein Rhopal_001620-T1 [Rhodotorula paludigena]
MQEGAREEGVVGARPTSAPASDLGTGHLTAHDEGDDDELSASEEAQPDRPLWGRPPSLCEAARGPVDGADERASAPTALSRGEVAPPAVDELVLLTPRPRPLSSLSRLSRRATLCLSTLSLFDTAIDNALSTATANESDGNDPGVQEQSLIERALKEEVEQVREEVAEAVKNALNWEQELDIVGSGEAGGEQEQDATTNDQKQELGQDPAFARLRSAEDLDTDAVMLALSSLVSLSDLVH